MGRYASIYMLLIALAVFTLFSRCERRPLEEEKVITALIPFTIDWSQSELDQAAMKRASIWFFPHDGSRPFEWRMQDDLTHTVVPLPIGKYSIVLFNETIDESDWEAIVFEGMDKYETFSVYTKKGDFKGLSTRADELDIRRTPDALACWSLSEFEVTLDMVAYTNSRGTKSEQLEVVTKSLEELSTITPLPLTIHVNVKAHIQNLKSALRCSATFNGATGRISLATGKPIVGDVSHIFIMNNRKYDPDNALNGTIEANLLLFRLVEGEVKFELQLDFEIIDGFKIPAEIFDVTSQVDQNKVTLQVKVGMENNQHDHPIILPSVELGSQVGVDNWDDVTIPLN